MSLEEKRARLRRIIQGVGEAVAAASRHLTRSMDVCDALLDEAPERGLGGCPEIAVMREIVAGAKESARVTMGIAMKALACGEGRPDGGG